MHCGPPSAPLPCQVSLPRCGEHARRSTVRPGINAYDIPPLQTIQPALCPRTCPAVSTVLVPVLLALLRRLRCVDLGFFNSSRAVAAKTFSSLPSPFGILKCVLVFSRSLALSSGPNNVLPTFRFPPPLFVIHDPGVCAVFRFRDPKLGHAVGSSDDVYYYIGERLGASSKGGRVAAHTASSHQLLGDAWSRR